MTRGSSRAFVRSRWFMLATCILLGGVSVLVSWLGGQLTTGLIGLVILVGFGLFIAVVVGWLVEIARGHSGSPYDWLGAVGGLAYALAVALQRWRG